ncbi:tRNA uridine-5-carboxymethylaminomethyl(34) synthesis enzyme MnmG [Helicobacter sp. MIT 01-3238]|uniref:tRNA uridine-5-carboxymethylaminomethyl(34) synthesis enzyme MnmG n=1 Tax=Helicobacter sp. MIT 01-3238 TaxID=398627 RepID=UPI000E1F4F4B|nr:tRNA uridine-5-carboxymethylaminomethyl(34) synthesis enzyme MnmG [Helicobacter sp. MIT 01-3238]RDU51701.1 tRNA uridine-5-carboxymethylaminomethyl(34) synthesis enzyme MnmG [Helicobacter sp. MIT 01-3238]
MKKNHKKDFDIIVVGGGHAGLEAACIAAKMGAKVHLLTILVENIALASCNPAIGGLGKGHLVKEIDALGGVMGRISDKCGIQYRTLNASKGPAVRGTRAQIDMDAYRIYARNLALNTPNLTISQEMACEILLQSDGLPSKSSTQSNAKSKNPHDLERKSAKAIGIRTNIGKSYYADKIIITTGTFLRGLVHIGENQIINGRFGESASNELSQSLKNIGLKLGRLKTGTCPRIDGRSIDFASLERHIGDENPPHFSYHTSMSLEKSASDFAPQDLPCFVTYTNQNTHKIIRENFHRAPLFTGQIEGVGPRYCPSIEDKINRFADKERHQLFLEPQTKDCVEYYINGLTTSLPVDVQEKVIHSIKGLENARITRYGYAIEYDYVEPTQLKHTLECKEVDCLYLAGQINGTTGYEEAGALGLMAGINAALSLKSNLPKKAEILENHYAKKRAKSSEIDSTLYKLVFRRDESYIGVMIDDLVTKGTKEPYRLFTSRAEYRLLLREDNAIYRLLEYANALGTISPSDYAIFAQEKRDIASAMEYLEAVSITPAKRVQEFLASINQPVLNDKTALVHIVGRGEFGQNLLQNEFSDFFALEEFLEKEALAKDSSLRVAQQVGQNPAQSISQNISQNLASNSVKDLTSKADKKENPQNLLPPKFHTMSKRALSQIQILSKYHNYIQKQLSDVANMNEMLKLKIPQDFEYRGISGLSLEVVEKLSLAKPATLFEASKISGITPASLDVLHLYIHLRS